MSDDYIYYINADDNGAIYRIQTDGSGKQKLSNDSSDHLNLFDERLYYHNSDDYGIYSMKTDGSDRQRLGNGAAMGINVVDDRIFYAGGGIFSMNADGSDVRTLCDDDSMYLNVSGGRIFYSNWYDSRKLYSISLDGSDRRKLNDDDSSLINIVGHWVFYLYDDLMYMMRTDGSELQRISSVPDSSSTSSVSEYLNDVTYKGIEVSRILDELPESTVGTPTKIEGPYYFYDGLEIYFNGYVDLVQGTKLNLFDIDGVTLDKNRAELIAAFGNPVEYYEYDDYTYSDSYYGDSMMRYHVSSYIAEYMLDFWFDDPGDKAYLVSFRRFGQ